MLSRFPPRAPPSRCLSQSCCQQRVTLPGRNLRRNHGVGQEQTCLHTLAIQELHCAVLPCISYKRKLDLRDSSVSNQCCPPYHCPPSMTMADTPKVEKKVHDIDLDFASGTSYEQSVQQERRTSIADTSHYARPRPFHIPRHVSYSYPAFKAKQECALKIGMQDFEREMRKSTGIASLVLAMDKLTIHLSSQSKLSQQELVDLQKATHFDKKELQQWYKGWYFQLNLKFKC